MVEMKKILQSPVQITALGGLGEVGKNLYCVENATTMLLIDCGVMFSDDDLPGVDYIIPEFTHIVENLSKQTALVITHGHEDHIGGIPFLLQQANIPFIYAPKIAAALIRRKISDQNIKTNTKIVEYDENSKLNIGEFKVEFFRVTHSIPDSFALYITTPQGTIVESGDFKIDLTPVGADFALSKLIKFADKGIDLLMADSTNAEKEGYTNSERNVIRGIQDVFSDAKGRIIITTFSSNIARIEQIISMSMKYKRKVAVVGRSMQANIETAREYGYISAPDSEFIDIDDTPLYNPNLVTIVCTGTQGEQLSVLARISRGEHKSVKVAPGDTIVFSSSIIPGNTYAVNKVVNALCRQGANVITNTHETNLHASGHASQQEMKLLQKLARPKYFMPIHGEYRMLKLHAALAVECGLSKDHTFICENGDVLQLINHNVKRGGYIKAESVYIDGKNPIGVSNTIMRDRTMLVNEGMVAVFLLLDSKTGKLLSKPVLESRGFSSSTSKSFKRKAEEIIGIEIVKYLKSNPRTSFMDLKNTIKNATARFFFREYHRNPVVIPVIFNYNPERFAKW